MKKFQNSKLGYNFFHYKNFKNLELEIINKT